MGMSQDNKDLLIGLGIKLAQMALAGAGAAAIKAWNTHVQAVAASEESGVPLTYEAQRAITAAIRSSGEDLLAVDTSVFDIPSI